MKHSGGYTLLSLLVDMWSSVQFLEQMLGNEDLSLSIAAEAGAYTTLHPDAHLTDIPSKPGSHTVVSCGVVCCGSLAPWYFGRRVLAALRCT